MKPALIRFHSWRHQLSRVYETASSLTNILYSGVVASPESDIRKVDLYISKADGLLELLRHISELLKPDR